jgi:hypothetical protein
MFDEFEDPASTSRLPMAPGSSGHAITRQRAVVARLVSRVYRAANDAMRAEMLARLLRPLGILSLVAVASGAFARLLQSNGVVPDTISTADVVRYSSDQILELTLFVQEVNPDTLQQLAEQLAQNTMGMTALSATALVLLHRRLRPSSGPSTVAAVFPGQPTDRGGSSMAHPK